jgi:hypothetical protein
MNLLDEFVQSILRESVVYLLIAKFTPRAPTTDPEVALNFR